MRPKLFTIEIFIDPTFLLYNYLVLLNQSCILLLSNETCFIVDFMAIQSSERNTFQPLAKLNYNQLFCVSITPQLQGVSKF